MDRARTRKRQLLIYENLRLDNRQEVEVVLYEVLPEDPCLPPLTESANGVPTPGFLSLLNILRFFGLIRYRYLCNAYLLFPLSKLPLPEVLWARLVADGITCLGQLMECWPDFLRLAEEEQLPVNRFERWLWMRGVLPGNTMPRWVRDNLEELTRSFSDLLFVLPRPTPRQLFPAWSHHSNPNALNARGTWVPPPLALDMYPVLTLPPLSLDNVYYPELKPEPVAAPSPKEGLQNFNGLLPLQPASWPQPQQ